jgi:hypothetical protein
MSISLSPLLTAALTFAAIAGIGIFFTSSRPSLSGTGMKDEIVLPAVVLLAGFVVLWLLMRGLT